MVARQITVLMLGWEFPPHITGGLGTACEGLSRALAKRDVFIHFLMPHLLGDESAPHLCLYDVSRGTTQNGAMPQPKPRAAGRELADGALDDELVMRQLEEILIYGIPSHLTPYRRPEAGESRTDSRAWTEQDLRGRPAAELRDLFAPDDDSVPGVGAAAPPGAVAHYGSRLFEEVRDYARRAAALAAKLDFEVVHAHDWMTYPAALRIGARSGKPVILHVHSLESDRSGSARNELIAHIERQALHAADSIIAVSHYTKARIVDDYGVAEAKIRVVHNGLMERKRVKPVARGPDGLAPNAELESTVLFLGRVTFQKGPDYFVEAALQVLQILPRTRFILAGSGDMLERLRARVRAAGAEKSFWMPGFLRGQEVDEVFANADLYVMPSVSEPFGISALEALFYDVPVIVSRQSGVSEVIRHALKADFWDVDELADLIVGALKFPQLRHDLLHMAKQEVRRLDWDASAEGVRYAYEAVLGSPERRS